MVDSPTYIEEYYSRNPRDLTPRQIKAKVRQIDILSKTQQDLIIKRIEDKKEKTEELQDRGWKVSSVLDIGVRRIVYKDRRGATRARAIRSGRFKRVPRRFREA